VTSPAFARGFFSTLLRQYYQSGTLILSIDLHSQVLRLLYKNRRVSTMSDIPNFSPMSTDDAADGRRSARVPVDFAVQVFTNNTTCNGRGHELGTRGMAIHVPMDLHEGDSIRIMFQPPNSKARFGVFGLIRNRENFRYGIEFRELSRGETTELERVVATLAPKNSVAS
jgi:PilZ domain